jgi:hypothetical protein
VGRPIDDALRDGGDYRLSMEPQLAAAMRAAANGAQRVGRDRPEPLEAALRAGDDGLISAHTPTIGGLRRRADGTFVQF